MTNFLTKTSLAVAAVAVGCASRTTGADALTLRAPVFSWGLVGGMTPYGKLGLPPMYTAQERWARWYNGAGKINELPYEDQRIINENLLRAVLKDEYYKYMPEGQNEVRLRKKAMFQGRQLRGATLFWKELPILKSMKSVLPSWERVKSLVRGRVVSRSPSSPRRRDGTGVKNEGKRASQVWGDRDFDNEEEVAPAEEVALAATVPTVEPDTQHKVEAGPVDAGVTVVWKVRGGKTRRMRGSEAFPEEAPRMVTNASAGEDTGIPPIAARAQGAVRSVEYLRDGYSAVNSRDGMTVEPHSVSYIHPRTGLPTTQYENL